MATILKRAAAVFIPVFLLGCAIAEIGRRSFAELPGNPVYWANRAALADQAGENPAAAWRRAAELAPREALYRSRLGIAEEAEGDFLSAERDLVLASELSRKFEPHWNLLNFYFRRGRWQDFWRAAPAALAASYGDRTPLFDLCRRAEGGAEKLDRLLPQRREIRMAYLGYLMAHAEFASAEPWIDELAASTDTGESDLFRSWCDALLAAHRVPEATRLWEILHRRGVVLEDAFPWRVNEVAGVTVHERAPGAWQILLSGEQPEQCVLLSRIAPVAPQAPLCLRADAQPALAPGLSWQVESYEPKPRALEFGKPPGVDAVRVTLAYRRPLGTVRAEAAMEIGGASLGACK